jgi:hypothetical protein
MDSRKTGSESSAIDGAVSAAGPGREEDESEMDDVNEEEEEETDISEAATTGATKK